MEDDPFLINLSFNVVEGGEGDDLLLGSIGPDLHGGRDIMVGLGGDDTMYGYWGNDTLNGGEGADHMEGHSGNDFYRVDNVGDVVREFANEGIDEVNTSIDYTLPDHVENLTLWLAVGSQVFHAARGTGNALDNEITSDSAALTDNVLSGLGGDDTLRGWGGNDQLDGGADNDTLEGGNGNDELYGGSHGDTLDGGANDDLLDGGTGGDNMRGGSGDDDYYADNAADRAIEDVDQGYDRVFSTVTFALEANVEELRLLAEGGAINGTGNDLDNDIYGNDSSNTLDGRGGGDRMVGNGGDDTYHVDSADDRVFESAREGIDTVFASVSFTLAGDVENLTLTGGGRLDRDQAFSGTGNGLDNVIIGNGLGNTLHGRGGDDEIDGGRGEDTIDGGLGDDSLVGGDEIDTVSFESWDPTGPLTNPLENITIALGQGSVAGTAAWNVGTLRLETDTLSGFENVRGSNRAEAIVGNGGNNVLEGRGGADVLQGHAGNDRLDGGLGVDTASYHTNAGPVVVILGQNGAAGQAQEFVFQPNGQFSFLSADTLISIENARGSSAGDTLIGNELDNLLDGLGGADTMRAGGGSDTYIVDNSGDTITEAAGQGSDTLRTSVSYTLTAGADVETLETTQSTGTQAIHLTGNNTGNVVRGNNGDNTLSGAGGNDFLTGLGGEDLFFFNSALDPLFNVDEITDFNVADDTIVLENAVFTTFAVPGNLARDLTAAEFVIGTAAQDASDRVIYNNATGVLLYDADGVGGAAAIRFAEVTPGLALTHLDFLVV
jgi:Ca2+-binding RTX toxin-like protein